MDKIRTMSLNIENPPSEFESGFEKFQNNYFAKTKLGDYSVELFSPSYTLIGEYERKVEGLYLNDTKIAEPNEGFFYLTYPTKVTYVNVFKGIDFVLIKTDEGIEERIIFHKKFIDKEVVNYINDENLNISVRISTNYLKKEARQIFLSEDNSSTLQEMNELTPRLFNQRVGQIVSGSVTVNGYNNYGKRIEYNGYGSQLASYGVWSSQVGVETWSEWDDCGDAEWMGDYVFPRAAMHTYINPATAFNGKTLIESPTNKYILTYSRFGSSSNTINIYMDKNVPYVSSVGILDGLSGTMIRDISMTGPSPTVIEHPIETLADVLSNRFVFYADYTGGLKQGVTSFLTSTITAQISYYTSFTLEDPVLPQEGQEDERVVLNWEKTPHVTSSHRYKLYMAPGNHTTLAQIKAAKDLLTYTFGVDDTSFKAMFPQNSYYSVVVVEERTYPFGAVNTWYEGASSNVQSFTYSLNTEYVPPEPVGNSLASNSRNTLTNAWDTWRAVSTTVARNGNEAIQDECGGTTYTTRVGNFNLPSTFTTVKNKSIINADFIATISEIVGSNIQLTFGTELYPDRYMKAARNSFNLVSKKVGDQVSIPVKESLAEILSMRSEFLKIQGGSDSWRVGFTAMDIVYDTIDTINVLPLVINGNNVKVKWINHAYILPTYKYRFYYREGDASAYTPDEVMNVGQYVESDSAVNLFDLEIDTTKKYACVVQEVQHFPSTAMYLDGVTSEVFAIDTSEETPTGPVNNKSAYVC